MQKILVFQQNNSAESKIKGIKRYGEGLFALEIVSVDEPLPPVIDDTKDYLPSEIRADLVLDYLRQSDLSYDLAAMCREKKIPVIASGKKLPIKGVLTPPTCCGLAKWACLGAYGERFGMPEFDVEVHGGKITRVRVLRGAPCGATWEAAARVVGLSARDAAVRIGLETQLFCTADPSGWDPICGKSPVHFAGKLHTAALKSALNHA